MQMHPEEIKAALRMKGVTLTALADEVGVSRSMVTHVIHGHARSSHVMERIAKIIDKAVDSIWTPSPVLRRSRVAADAARQQRIQTSSAAAMTCSSECKPSELHSAERSVA